MFKNALVYRFDPATLPPLAELEERLAGAGFVPCTPTQPLSIGFVPPRGEAHGALAERVAGQLVLRLLTETRAVPGSAVKDALQEALDKAEAETGRRPKGKAARELKEAVVHTLLPRAFPKRRSTLVWLDTEAGWLWVGAGSQKQADAVVTLLLERLGGTVKTALLQTQLAPATAMAQWLAAKEPPAGFSIDRDCELKQADSEKATVRYARHALDIEEVVAHIEQGKQVTRLALTWAGRVSFVLTEALVLKSIELLDGVLEGAGVDAANAGKAEEGFDADVAIATGELRQLLPALVDALGGLQPAPGEAAAATQAAPQRPAAPAPTAAAGSIPPWETAAA